MKKFALLAAAATMALAGCSSGPEAEWIVPLELGDSYTTTNVLSIAEANGAVVVPVSNTVYGFNAASNELAWTVTLGEEVSQCLPAGSNVLCATGLHTTVALDREGNSAEHVGLAVEYSGPAGVYVAQAYEDRVELIKADPDASIDDIASGETVAVYDLSLIHI